MPTYTVRINGRTHEVEGDPDDSLLSVLRYDLDLIGSKFGCGEGACGACTVLVDNQAARSCVTRLSAVAGKAVTTIEGLGGQAAPSGPAGVPRCRSVSVRLLHAGDGDGDGEPAAHDTGAVGG